MRQAAAPATVARYFGPRFPNQLPEHIAIAEALDGPTITLEGAELIAVEAGHTDTINTTFLHVPALDLVVAGDVVYNDVHLFVAQTTHESRQDWIAALDLIESKNPRVVVAGHKRPGAGDPPSSLADTRVYLRDFDRLSQSTQSDAELFEAMMSLYPNRLNGQGWLMF